VTRPTPNILLFEQRLEGAALPRISLILATITRVDLVERFLLSVIAQGYPNLEVLVADQNTDDRLTKLVASLSAHLHIRHLRTSRGLSRSRNVALRHITGDIVAFPDDDATYPTGLLHSVARMFRRYPGVGGLVGCPVSEISGSKFRGFASRPRDITPRNAWSLVSSIGLFLRVEVTEMVGAFDETLGLGSGTPWGAGEDRDYPLRAIDLGTRLRYDPELKIRHPESDYSDLQRAYLYGSGLGRVLRKRSARPIEVLRLIVVRPIGGIALAILRGRWCAAAFYFHSLRGRISGWRASTADWS
jgi:cellulose synthase/poly-beta-1,6-N-acetylglucosamine synthase-like glycosyltransferase